MSHQGENLPQHLLASELIQPEHPDGALSTNILDPLPAPTGFNASAELQWQREDRF